MSGGVDDPPVVVLRTEHYPRHPGTIGLVRSLGRAGVPVHVFGERPGTPVARSRYVRSVRPLPWRDPPPDALVGWLLSSAPPGRPVLAPVDDVGALLLAEWSAELAERYRFPQPPPGLAARLCDKAGLAELADEAAVPRPAHRAPATPEEFEAVLPELEFPVVVKARDPRLLRRTPGVRSVGIARDAASLRSLWRRHLVDGRANCLIQEFIPGGPETVWMVNAYVDSGSELHLAASGRKIRQRPAYTGATTLGVIQRNDEVLALTAQLIRAVGYRGVLDIGWRFDARDGRYKVLDLNPRIGATFRLFAAADGADVVQALYADLTGRPLPEGAPAEGRRWISEFQDVAVARRYIRDGALTTTDYLRSLRGVDERAWWAADDRTPALVALRQRAWGGRRGRRRGDDAVAEPQTAEYFDERAGFWDGLYDGDDVFARIHRRRHAAAAAWLRATPPGGTVLELGCGAGRLTAELSTRSHVVAVDTSRLMLCQARRRATAAGFLTADAARLPLADASVDAVVALGVLPWVADHRVVAAEIARVVRPGGTVVLNVDNRWRLGTLLDPRHSPLTAPARRALRRRVHAPAGAPRVTMVSPPAGRRALAEAGLTVVEERWLGFGPFTLLGRPVLPDDVATRIDDRLQRRADAGGPVRHVAAQYLVRCVRTSGAAA